MKRDLQLTRRASGAEVLTFKGLVRTHSGIEFDPSADRWWYRDGVIDVGLDFGQLRGASPELVEAAKAALTWYAEHRSPSHVINMFRRLQHFLRSASQESRLLDSIEAVDLLNYKASLGRDAEWYLGAIAGFIRRWHRLGYQGVSEDAILLLKQLRIRGNRKGQAVLTMDPREGPFSYLEVEALQSALNVAYAEGRVDNAQFVLAWLYMLLGQRNTQHAALKVCDVECVLGDEGSRSYAIMMPRAKQGHPDPRDSFTRRPLVEQFGEVLHAYAERMKGDFVGLLAQPAQAPLFPSVSSALGSEGYEFHVTAKELGHTLTVVLEGLDVTSERTGERLNVTAVRFRRTIGTRAAEEGYGPLVIAKLLDHTDTQQVGVYTANSPAIIDRVDRGTAMGMAPLAQSFIGQVTEGPAEGGDASKRIIDLRIDRSGEAMGKCGQHSFCGFNAPIACYTCKNFEAWLDGPHEAVLTHLLENRERLLQSSDKRIASINDRTIFAVAAVIKRCEELRAEQGPESTGALDV